MKKYVIIDLCNDAGRNFIMSQSRFDEYEKKLGFRTSHSATLSDAMFFDSEEQAEVEIVKRKLKGVTIMPIFNPSYQ